MVVELINNELPKDRLARLRSYLAAELKSDDPSAFYIQDLKESIRRLEQRQ